MIQTCYIYYLVKWQSQLKNKTSTHYTVHLNNVKTNELVIEGNIVFLQESIGHFKIDKDKLVFLYFKAQ